MVSLSKGERSGVPVFESVMVPQRPIEDLGPGAVLGEGYGVLAGVEEGVSVGEPAAEGCGDGGEGVFDELAGVGAGDVLGGGGDVGDEDGEAAGHIDLGFVGVGVVGEAFGVGLV